MVQTIGILTVIAMATNLTLENTRYHEVDMRICWSEIDSAIMKLQRGYVRDDGTPLRIHTTSRCPAEYTSVQNNSVESHRWKGRVLNTDIVNTGHNSMDGLRSSSSSGQD